MFLLEANNIEKQYGARTVLSFGELRIYAGDKIGIVGENGAGKTTLLQILAEEVKPDKGSVTRHTSIHYLKQFVDGDNKLSGGENQKREILRLSQNKDALVFADEPTANLDLNGRQWVQSQLKEVNTLVIISHDRTLLDSVCTSIIEVKNGKIELYTGNYTSYVEELERKKGTAAEDYYLQNIKKIKMEKAIQKKQASIDRSRKRFKARRIKNESEARLGKNRIEETYAKKQQELKTLKKRADRMENISRPDKEKSLRIDFDKTDPPRNKRIISSNSFSFSYGDNIVFEKARFEVFREEKLAIMGANGSGKTTLVKEIVNRNPDINVVPKVKIGYLTQNFSQIDEDKTIMENTLLNNVQSSEDVFSVLAGLRFTKEEINKPAKVLSGGERVRLGLAMLIVADINTLILDEPTNFLDINSVEALENTLVNYPGAVILISHDDHFVNKVATRKLVTENGKIITPAGNKPKVEVGLLTLEINRTRLVEELKDASGEEKTRLETEYREVISMINSIM